MSKKSEQKTCKDWKNELARDMLALGSIPFYLIVIIRAIVGQFPPFVYQLVIALLVLSLAWLLYKDANQHIARGFILVVFTSLFYKEWLYVVFAVLLWLGMVYSLYFLKYRKTEIIYGVIFGVVSGSISYFASILITA